MKKKLIVLSTGLLLAISLLSPQVAFADYDWTYTGGPSTDEIADLAYDEYRDILYAADSAGKVFRCTDPTSSPSWQDITGGIGAVEIWDIEYDGNNNFLYAATDTTVMRREDPDGAGIWEDTDPWVFLGGVNVPALVYDPEDNVLYAGCQNGGGPDGGVWRLRGPERFFAWTSLTGVKKDSWVNCLEMVGDRLYVGLPGDQGLYVSPDPNTDSLPADLDAAGLSSKTIIDLLYCESGNALYSITLYSLYGTFRCSNPDESASSLSWESNNWPGGRLNDLAFDENSEILYGAGNPGVWRCQSPDTTSASWSDTGGDVDAYEVYSLACDNNNWVIYAGLESNGVYRSDIAPLLDDIDPDSGYQGEQVTLTGSNFGDTRGSSYVSFGSEQVATYGDWRDDRITCTVPEGVWGTVQVSVTNDGGTSNAVDFEVLSQEYYFAEGYTGGDFQEYLCLGNANSFEVTVDVTYMYVDGTTDTGQYDVPANSRYTVNVNDVVGPGREVSIKVASPATNVVAERPMYFDYNGEWPGGHDAVGAPAPTKKWYFAEGTTRPEFEEYITVQNPGSTEANLVFRYMVEGVGEEVFTGQVGANSRATFEAVDHVGYDKDISLLVESDVDVVVERPMYFDYLGLAVNHWKGGHCVVGTNAPDTQWYFAEGTTRSGFEEWLTIQNPNGHAISVDATYMLGKGQGAPVVRQYQVGATERLTVSVNKELGEGYDVSTYLSSDDSFIAERPMYFDYEGTADYSWTGGHDVLGANSPAELWFLAEGYTGSGFEEWICIQNPTSEYVTIGITYYPRSGSPIYANHAIDPKRRLTIGVNADAGRGLELSTRIESDRPVIVERPMYFNYDGVWPGGHDVVGFTY